MRALQYRTIGSAPEVVEVPTPEPGPGQVLLKVTAAGACHSDEFVMSLPADQYTYGLPLTLGHEGVGSVAALGDGVEGLELGDSVAVYGPWGCGRCAACSRGAENYCTRAAELGIRPPGLGAPGSMAEYLLIDDPRHLVPLDGLDPAAAVSLTDAGLTPYHAVKTSLPKLGAGTTAVVIGTGGLGHVGIQVLKAITGATVIALDVNEEKLKLAHEVGADHAFLSNDDAVTAIRDLTGGLGANAVFDFVDAPPTIALGAQILATEADWNIVGIGRGVAQYPAMGLPFDVAVRRPYWGTRAELIEVLDLARAGKLTVETEQFSLDQAPEVYERLHAGTLRGRGVVVP